MSDDRRHVEQEGIKYFGFIMSKLKTLVREVSSHDKGIDLEVELDNKYSINGINCFVGIQVKSRTEAKKLASGDFSITVTEQNIQYWKAYGRPVFLILYDIDSQSLYLRRVDTHFNKTIHVDKLSLLNADTIKHFHAACLDYNIKSIFNYNISDLESTIFSMGETVGDIAQPVIEKVKSFHLLVNENKFEAAYAEIKPLAEIYRTTRSIVAGCAYVLSMSNNELAMRYVNKLLELPSLSIRDYSLAAYCCAQFNEFSRAETIFEAWYRKDDTFEMLHNYALACYWSGDYVKSKFLFDEVNEKMDIDEHIAFNFALISTAIEDYDAAVGFYDVAISKSVSFCDAYNNKALLLKNLGRHQLAMECFQAAVDNNAVSELISINYAGILKDYGRDEDALGFFIRAKEVSDRVDVYINLALIYCRLGDNYEAELLFNSEVVRSYFSTQPIQQYYVMMDIGFAVGYCVRLAYSEDGIIVDSIQKINLDEIIKSSCENSGFDFEKNKEQFWRSPNPKDKLIMPPSIQR
ncbi:MAG: DUF4365 domain-containing protein [Proteobacteria bacterium]|nr:DUF4365 domain-containing protein [Pseudomonadota bacterium]